MAAAAYRLLIERRARRRAVGSVLEELTDEESAACQALMRVVFALPRAITADITPACGVGLSDYLALDLLSKAPGRQLRMTELAAACGVSLSGISRIMNRLDRAGQPRPDASAVPSRRPAVPVRAPSRL
jgi:MarR family